MEYVRGILPAWDVLYAGESEKSSPALAILVRLGTLSIQKDEVRGYGELAVGYRQSNLRCPALHTLRGLLPFIQYSIISTCGDAVSSLTEIGSSAAGALRSYSGKSALTDKVYSSTTSRISLSEPFGLQW